MKKIIALFCAVILLVQVFSFVTFATEVENDFTVSDGWAQTENGQWIYLKNGNRLTQWQKLSWSGGEDWFYFNLDGIMQSGWKNDIPGWNCWFFFDSNGAMATGWKNDIPGWNDWFYFGDNGVMATGWRGDTKGWEGSYFFFDLSLGVMATGTRTMSRVTYTFDNNGVCVSPNSIQFRLVLDPGHGADADGTTYTYDGVLVKEKDIVMKIAKNIRSQLQGYKTEDGQNIDVVLTRETGPDGSGDTLPELDERVRKGVETNAQSVISLHINASSDGSQCYRGAMMLPTSSNYGGLYDIEDELSKSILNGLSSVGVSISDEYTETIHVTDGILRKTSDNGSTYPNGDEVDWYGIVRNGIEMGIPAIIVEHAYLDNESDYREFFSTDEQLQNLALGDVRGLAEYYKLSPR